MSVSTWAVGIKSGLDRVVMPAARTVSDVSAGGGTASITYESGGDLTFGGVAADPVIDEKEWYTRKSLGVGVGFEIRATQVSGQPAQGSPLGEWLPLSTTRFWSYSNSIGIQSSVIDVEIRTASTAVVQGETRVTLTAGDPI